MLQKHLLITLDEMDKRGIEYQLLDDALLDAQQIERLAHYLDTKFHQQIGRETEVSEEEWLACERTAKLSILYHDRQIVALVDTDYGPAVVAKGTHEEVKDVLHAPHMCNEEGQYDFGKYVYMHFPANLDALMQSEDPTLFVHPDLIITTKPALSHTHAARR